MRATYHKLHAAYKALEVAKENAGPFDAEVIAEAMSCLIRASKRLATQECWDCDDRGYLDTAAGCIHPDVIQYDIRTGKETKP